MLINTAFNKSQRNLRNQRSNCKNPLDLWKSKRIPNFCFIYYPKVFDCVDHNKLWKSLQDMGLPGHLTCLLRNLYGDQEVSVRRDVEQWIGSKLRKEYVKAIYFHLVYWTYMQNTSCKMQDEAQAGIKIVGESAITSDMQITPLLWQKVKRNQRPSWWKWKRRVKKLA